MLEKKIKIAFTDFWPEFKISELNVYKILNKYFSITLVTKNPDVLIYSVFGNNHFEYKNCIKIKVTGENVDFDNLADYEFGMDYGYSVSNPKYFYCPLFFMLYDSRWNLKHNIIPNDTNRKFCGFLVSNSYADKRTTLFNYISKFYKKIDSGGNHLNNIGYVVPNTPKDTNAFWQQYKFSLSCENSMRMGYLTEKLFIALYNGCIPIYWGDPRVNIIVNPQRFINANNLTPQRIIERIKKIESSKLLYLDIVNQPIFNDEYFYDDFKEKLENFIKKIFNI